MKNLKPIYITISKIVSLLIIILASLKLAGWVFNIPVFFTEISGTVIMRFNAAVCFFIAGLILYLLDVPEIGRSRKITVSVLSTVVFLTGLTTFLQHIYGWNMGIDELLVKDGISGFHGRMSLMISCNFVFLGCIFFLSLKKIKPYLVIQSLLFVIIFLSVLSSLAKFFGTSFLFNIEFFYLSASSANWLFILLSIGIMYIRPLKKMVLSFQAKLSGIFIVICLLLGIIFFAYNKNREQTVNSSIWLEHIQKELLQAQKINLQLNEIQSGIRGFVFTGEERYLPLFTNGSKRISDQISSIRILSNHDIRDQWIIDSMKVLIESYIASGKELISLCRSKGFETAQKKVMEGNGYGEIEKIRSVIQSFEQKKGIGLTEHKTENSNYIKNSTRIINLLQVVTFLLILAGVVMIYQNFRFREKAVKKLQVSEEQYRNLVENSMVGVIRTKVNGDIIYVNGACLKIFEFDDAHEFVSLSSTIRYKYPVQRKVMIATLAEAGHVDSYEATVLTKNNNERIILFSLAVNGDIMDGTLIDISDRKLAETKLTRNLKFTEALLNSIPTPVFFKDMQGRYTGCNRAFCDQLGVTSKEINGKTAVELWPNDSQAKCYYQKDMELLANPKHLVYESKVTDKNSQIRDVIFAKDVFLDEDGKVAGIIGTYIDISERKRAEEKIHQLSQAIEQSPVSVVITDTAGIIEYVNPKFVELTGYSFNEAIGNNPRILKSGHTSREEYEQLWKTITNGDEWHGEFRDRKKNGDLYWESATISSIINAQGKITNYLAVKEDITERKKAETVSKKYEIELEKSNSELEHFAYAASHDLQEPLRMVSSFLNLLEKRLEGKLDETAQQYIHFAVDGAGRMKTLIKDLLEYSKVGTNKEGFTATDLNETMQYVLRMLNDNIVKKNAVITVKPLPVITVNKTLFGQLFANLLSNALKYCDGEIPEIEVGCTEEADEYIFYVKDNGIGIDPQFHDKIFVIFKRLHGKKTYSGTGIGLAVCKKIIDIHKGKIRVDSELGKGSTFYFSVLKKNRT